MISRHNRRLTNEKREESDVAAHVRAHLLIGRGIINEMRKRKTPPPRRGHVTLITPPPLPPFPFTGGEGTAC